MASHACGGNEWSDYCRGLQLVCTNKQELSSRCRHMTYCPFPQTLPSAQITVMVNSCSAAALENTAYLCSSCGDCLFQTAALSCRDNHRADVVVEKKKHCGAEIHNQTLTEQICPTGSTNQDANGLIRKLCRSRNELPYSHLLWEISHWWDSA